MMESSIELLIRYNTLYGRCIRISNERNELLRVLAKMVKRDDWYSYVPHGGDDGWYRCNHCLCNGDIPSLIKHDGSCSLQQAKQLVEELTMSKEGFL